MRQQVWRRNNTSFYVGEDSNTEKRLPNGVFSLEFDKRIDGCYLKRLSDEFEFPYKIYGVNSDFINRVMKTYEKTSSNLGILLNGIRGTGKTVTGQIIANRMKIPIIIISTNYDEKLVDFINDIDQDVVIFIDEYEKVFEKSRQLLTVMDGVFNNPLSRKTFILSTNNTYVEQNLLQRPGRIRYLKEFNNISEEVICEIVDDCLEYPEYKSELVNTIMKCELITIDIVKAFVQEINIHNMPPTVLFTDMNFKKKDPTYYEAELYYGNTLISRYNSFNKRDVSKMYNLNINEDITFKNVWIGTIIDKKEDEFLIQLDFERPLMGIKELDDLLELPETPDEKPKLFDGYFNQKDRTIDAPVVRMKIKYEDMHHVYAF